MSMILGCSPLKKLRSRVTTAEESVRMKKVRPIRENGRGGGPGRGMLAPAVATAADLLAASRKSREDVSLAESLIKAVELDTTRRAKLALPNVR